MSHHSSSGTLGTIRWEITEEPIGRTIYRGSRDIGRDDIEIVPRLGLVWPRETPEPLYFSVIRRVTGAIGERLTGGRKQYGKQIHLEGGFYLELVEIPKRQRKDVLGFGMQAQHEWTPTFSREWFRVAGSNTR